MRRKMHIISTIVITLLTLTFILVSSLVDVTKVNVVIGSDLVSYSLGLSSMNLRVHETIGCNQVCYIISQVLGYLAIAAGAVFAFIGIYQLIKRKSLFKVDKQILALGILFIVMALIYILFEVKPVNYRPEGVPFLDSSEPSFPSSHSLLAIVVFGGISIIIEDYIKNRRIALIIKYSLIGLALLTVILRFFSGVHWMSDIIAGILFGCSMLCLFILGLDVANLNEKKENNIAK